MTIGIDASRAGGKEKTGVEWYSYYIIKRLIEIDKRNQYILYYRDRPLDSLKTLKLLRWPFKYLWTQGRLSLEMLFHAPDVLFIPASAMPFIHPKNTVVAVHDIGFMRFPEVYKRRQRWYLKWSTRFAVRNAKKIITISKFSKREIIKYFKAEESKVEVIYLAYNSQRFQVIYDQERLRKVKQKYNIVKPFILFVSRLEKKKNINRLIKAFAVLKKNYKELSHQLVLVGNKGYGWQEAEVLIKKHNLQNEIIILGYAPDEDLPLLYNAAELFIFPSLYEGFGMPILEAMACGTPVITSNSSSCPEVAGEAAVFVDPIDYKQIAEKLAEVLTNNHLRQELIKKGLERVKRFSWKKCAQETLKLLRRF